MSFILFPMDSLAGLLGSYGPPPTVKKPAEEKLSNDEEKEVDTKITALPVAEVTLVDPNTSRYIELANSWLGENKTIPSPPDPNLTQRLEKFHKLHAQNLTFNNKLRGGKSFANPNILAKLVLFSKLDQVGTNCPPSLFSLSGFYSDDFYEGLGKRQEQREQRMRERTSEIEFTHQRWK